MGWLRHSVMTAVWPLVLVGFCSSAGGELVLPEQTPDTPPSGPLLGKADVILTDAAIKDGVLTLGNKDGDRAIIFLFLEKGDVPIGRTFNFSTPSKTFGQPHVHIHSVPQDGSTAMEVFTDGYAMRIAFGQETDEGLPGEIALALPDKDRSSLAGRFLAKIEGFRMIDGKPVMTTDSFETLKWAVRYHLESQHPGQPVQVNKSQNSWMRHASKGYEQAEASGEYKYVVGDVEPRWIKYQFVKGDQGWEVARKLESNQLAKAHPIEAPSDPSAVRWHTFERPKAAMVEARLQADYPGVGFWRLRAYGGVGQRFSLAKVTFHTDPDADYNTKPIEKTFVFETQDNELWQLINVLDGHHDIDMKTGEVRP